VIFLHIGRNKAGSTTLQSVLAKRSQALRAGGVRYLNFGHLAHSDPEIEGFVTAEPVAALARATGETLLISNEFMSVWPETYTWSMAKAFEGLQVKVLIYLRDYTTWLPSLYAQNVKSGDETRDFFAFVDDPPQSISAWPMIQTWAAAFGWNSLRIQAMDPQTMQAEDLVRDAFSALGLPADLAGSSQVQRSNVSLGWTQVEMIRAVRAALTEDQWGRQADDIVRLASLLPLSPPPGDPVVRYLDPGRFERLADLYDEDVERIAAVTGRRLPPTRRIELPPCSRAPTWADVSPDIVADWRGRWPADAACAPWAEPLLAQRRQG
jgi:hypothetical protein